MHAIPNRTFRVSLGCCHLISGRHQHLSYASPVAADGKVFFVSEAGKVVVVKAGGNDWEVLAVNDLGEKCCATPASKAAACIRGPAVPFTFGLVDRVGRRRGTKSVTEGQD